MVALVSFLESSVKQKDRVDDYTNVMPAFPAAQAGYSRPLSKNLRETATRRVVLAEILGCCQSLFIPNATHATIPGTRWPLFSREAQGLSAGSRRGGIAGRNLFQGSVVLDGGKQ